METPDLTKQPPEPAHQPMPSNPKGLGRVLRDHLGWALSLFLIGFAMKLVMLLRCENHVPYFDQWDGEAVDIYIPYFQHQLGLAELFRGHNEHRIFFTRIYDLALLWLNGQWDSQLQMVLNAAIHCATIAAFGCCMAGLMGRRSWPFIWLTLALALVLPFGWENALWGFQSQFYFLLIFTLLTIRLLGMSEPLTLQWRFGVLTAICALFTVASGFLAGSAVAAMIFLEILKNRAKWRRHLPTLMMCAAITLAGLLLKGNAPDSPGLHAHSLGDFLSSLGNNLSWPTGLYPWLAPLNLFPLILLGWLYFRSQEENHLAERMILGIGFWVLLQSLATAYARGAGGYPPAYRYMDTSVFVLIVNSLSILVVLGRYRPRLRFAPVCYAGFAVWAVPCLTSLWALSDRAWNVAIPIWANHQSIRLGTTRFFMATDDERIFSQQDPVDIPFPYVPELVFLLRNADVRHILPACVREPLKVIPKENDDLTFSRQGCFLAKSDPPTEIGWGSYSESNTNTRATFESAPIKKSTLPYLEIPVSGDLGELGLSLDLVDLVTGKTTVIKPSQVPGKQWLNAYVKAPAGEFKIVARDESASKWFAFKQPREMGWLSYWAMQMMAGAKYFFAAGSLCLLWNLILFLASRPSVNKSTA